MNLKQSITSLRAAGVIAIPTDTVYGLACLASNAEAVTRINQIKQRPQEKNYVLQVATLNQARSLIHSDQHNLLEKVSSFWPGEITFIFKTAKSLPYPYIGKTIAIRIPNHPLALSLLKQIGEPLVVTSLNRSGAPPILSSDTIPADLLMEVDGVIRSSRPLSNVASTIVDLSSSEPCIVRQGNIHFDLSLSL